MMELIVIMAFLAAHIWLVRLVAKSRFAHLGWVVALVGALPAAVVASFQIWQWRAEIEAFVIVVGPYLSPMSDPQGAAQLVVMFSTMIAFVAIVLVAFGTGLYFVRAPKLPSQNDLSQ